MAEEKRSISIVKNNSGLEIMTENGTFDPFWGLIEKKSHGYKLKLEDGRELKYSDGHRFMIDGWEVYVESLSVGDSIAGSTIVDIEEVTDTFYGPYSVRGHEYSTVDENGEKVQMHHNCEFMGSSTTLIELDKLAKLFPTEPKEFKYGYLVSIWEEPIPGAMYVMGVDTSTGSGLDFSAVQVLKLINKDKFEQVCTFHDDRTLGGKFSQIIKDLSEWYNDALIIIENNGPGKNVAEELWYTLDCQNIINTDPHGIGTNANKASKLEACLMLQREVNRDSLIIHDSATLKELTTFIEVSPNVFKATAGSHDDLVSALYWAVYAIFQPEIDLDNLKVDMNKREELVEVPQTVFPDEDDGVWTF